MHPQRFVAAKEAALAAGVHVRTLCRWVQRGEIRARRFGGVLRVALGSDGLPMPPLENVSARPAPAPSCAACLLEHDQEREIERELEAGARFLDPLAELADVSY